MRLGKQYLSICLLTLYFVFSECRNLDETLEDCEGENCEEDCETNDCEIEGLGEEEYESVNKIWDNLENAVLSIIDVLRDETFSLVKDAYDVIDAMKQKIDSLLPKGNEPEEIEPGQEHGFKGPHEIEERPAETEVQEEKEPKVETEGEVEVANEAGEEEKIKDKEGRGEGNVEEEEIPPPKTQSEEEIDQKDLTGTEPAPPQNEEVTTEEKPGTNVVTGDGSTEEGSYDYYEDEYYEDDELEEKNPQNN